MRTRVERNNQNRLEGCDTMSHYNGVHVLYTTYMNEGIIPKFLLAIKNSC